MFDEEIEKIVLYYLIFENEEIKIDEEDFFITKNKQIAKAIKELKTKKQEINIISIRNQINPDSQEILKYLSLIAEQKYVSTLDYAYSELKKLSKKRRILELANKLASQIRDIEDVDIYLEKQIKELNNISNSEQREKTFNEMLINTVEIIEQKRKREFDYKYFTGIFDLDKVTNGLQQEELTIIGARPGVGKTTFALYIADKVASRNVNVGFISLEMSENQIIQKLIAKRTRIDSNKIRTGSLTDEEIAEVGKVASELSKLNLNINTKAKNIQDIEIYARRMKNKQNLGLLIIDYIQLIKNKGNFSSREQEVADISRTLKLLALELKIPIIGLCQLNRNAAKSEPTLADLRESGAIEQDADNVIFLYSKDENQDKSNSVEDIIVDLQKQRAGGLTKVIVRFNKRTSEFINLER